MATELSEAAKELLLEASQDGSGLIVRFTVLTGTVIKTNEKAFGTENVRALARYESGIKQLRNLGLVEAQGFKDEVFKVTHEGYEVAEALRGQG